MKQIVFFFLLNLIFVWKTSPAVEALPFQKLCCRELLFFKVCISLSLTRWNRPLSDGHGRGQNRKKHESGLTLLFFCSDCSVQADWQGAGFWQWINYSWVSNVAFCVLLLMNTVDLSMCIECFYIMHKRIRYNYKRPQSAGHLDTKLFDAMMLLNYECFLVL